MYVYVLYIVKCALPIPNNKQSNIEQGNKEKTEKI
jgi:hypothetical protein